MNGGLSRERLVEAALALVQHDGLDALTMRALGDRLGVKAASLYWHVRDRAELLELLAQAVLKQTSSASRRGDWRAGALSVCASLERFTAQQRDMARLLLEVPGAIERSKAHADLASFLHTGGLSEADAWEMATMMLAAVLFDSVRSSDQLRVHTKRLLTLAVDSGSRGVTLRAGSTVSGVIGGVHDRSADGPAVIRGDRVIVRRLPGGRRSELELSSAHAWRFHIQAPTWNTVLNLAGLDVRGIHIDSGAMRVECILPPPRGVVPIDISSGVVGVRVRRPPGIALVADVSAGVVQLKLDGRTVGATTAESRWESGGGFASGDYYKLRISSGTVRVTIEEDCRISAEPVASVVPRARAGVLAALNVALDGVAAQSLNANMG